MPFMAHQIALVGPEQIVQGMKMQVSSSQNLQTIESVPGSLLAGAGKMVGTLHQVKLYFGPHQRDTAVTPLLLRSPKSWNPYKRIFDFDKY